MTEGGYYPARPSFRPGSEGTDCYGHPHPFDERHGQEAVASRRLAQANVVLISVL